MGYIWANKSGMNMCKIGKKKGKKIAARVTLPLCPLCYHVTKLLRRIDWFEWWKLLYTKEQLGKESYQEFSKVPGYTSLREPWNRPSLRTHK